ncbi:Protein kinase, putative [Hondaea fermentalgiana]|uniref:Protein kinase, putative n=1 Tax=Hondaea fermentalgiana TaxID=2315210 RepID=A0A2R5GH58_9STRA|nr:Protein kinase, putative [Hondaea fermentalgiana]|eukprot:GBG30227.1 Protein kinase, putative [Hondaea fermentalgiana]
MGPESFLMRTHPPTTSYTLMAQTLLKSLATNAGRRAHLDGFGGRLNAAWKVTARDSAQTRPLSSTAPEPHEATFASSDGRESEGTGARITSRGARGSGLPSAFRRRERSSRSLQNERLADRYEVKELIGRGGFGLVRLGIDTQDKNKCVALKCINKNADQRVLQTELSVLRQLMEVEKSDACARSLFTVPQEIIELEDQFVVVLEYLGGGDLFDRIVHLGHVPERDLKPVMRQVAHSLAHLHHQDIIHRDVKPENILFRVASRPNTQLDPTCIGFDEMLPWSSLAPVLCDFGLSHVFGTVDLIEPPAGTFGYASPQVLKREKNIDSACDMWSFGVMMYAALSGELPFPASTDGSTLMEEHLQEAYRGPRYSNHRWNDISLDAQHLISDLLHYSPFDRPTAVEVLRHPWLTTV